MLVSVEAILFAIDICLGGLVDNGSHDVFGLVSGSMQCMWTGFRVPEGCMDTLQVPMLCTKQCKQVATMIIKVIFAL